MPARHGAARRGAVVVTPTTAAVAWARCIVNACLRAAHIRWPSIVAVVLLLVLLALKPSFPYAAHFAQRPFFGDVDYNGAMLVLRFPIWQRWLRIWIPGAA